MKGVSSKMHVGSLLLIDQDIFNMFLENHNLNFLFDERGRL